MYNSTRGLGSDDFGGATGYDWNYYGYDAAGNTDASLGMPGAQGDSLRHANAGINLQTLFEKNKTAIYIGAGIFILLSLGGRRR